MLRINRNTFYMLCIMLLVTSNSFATPNVNGNEERNVTNEGQDENIRYHGKIIEKSGPEIKISENVFKPTPATVFYNENRGIISVNDFIVGEQVIFSYQPASMELIYLQKEDKIIPLGGKKGDSVDKQKQQNLINANKVNLTDGVYKN
jgi:hypothetical protein